VLLSEGRISGKIAKQILEEVIAGDKDPEAIVRSRGWEQISDPAKIAESVKAVYAEESSTVTELKTALAGGNQKRCQTLMAFLVGKVLGKTGGRADPKIVRTQLEELCGY
jgi:aspartyl-tRNA(Asn)/glutamyl-tRNA(Gln) amidotransferase subunit B